MEPFIIKRGDTSPSLGATLVDESGPVNLTGKTVRFVMRALKADGTDGLVKVDAAAAVDVALDGKVRYDWASGDLDIEGQFLGEFKVTSAGRVSTYPDKTYISVVVTHALQEG